MDKISLLVKSAQKLGIELKFNSETLAKLQVQMTSSIKMDYNIKQFWVCLLIFSSLLNSIGSHNGNRGYSIHFI